MISFLTRFLKSKTEEVVKPDALVDVRSYGGFKNHIVVYGNYEHPFVNEADRAALCGYTAWLSRGPLAANSPWLLDSSKPVTTEHFCATCAKLFNSQA